MNWYLAKVVYQIICGANQPAPQFEDQLRLIEAPDEAAAINKACAIGVNEQQSLFTQNQQLVQWKFINVCELYKLTEWLDGAELFSSITEVSNADLYIKLVNDKSQHMLQGNSRKQLNLV